jgi:hypothetical protein
MPEMTFSPSLSIFKIIIKQEYDVLEYYSMCTFPNLLIYFTDILLYCLYINPVLCEVGIRVLDRGIWCKEN